MTEKNPLIEQYNYWYPYQQNIDKLKESSPEILEFSQLCHDVFETPAGKKLMKILEDRYLLPVVPVGGYDYATLSVHANGFKAALLTLRQGVIEHQRRINKG